MNQAYVIATSTKVDISKVKVPATVNDAFFAAVEERKPKKEASFFELQESAKSKETSEARKAAQKAVDGSIKLSEEIKGYMKSTFSLRKGDKPHEMKF